MSRRGENIFKRKDGRWEGRYMCGFKNNGKTKYLSVYARSYLECSQKLQLAKADMLPRSNPVTMSKLFHLWLENRKNSIKLSTYVTYRTMYRNYISAAFDNMPAERITSNMLSSYMTHLLNSGGENGRPLSPKSVQAVFMIIRSVFAYAKSEYGLENPAENISLPKSEYREIEVFSNEEMEKIYKSALCGDHIKLGILLCLYTGLRIGEICALKWENIDVNESVIHVRKTLQRIKNPNNEGPKTIVIIEAPKSAKSIRDIPIPPFIMNEVKKSKDHIKPEYYFLTGAKRYIEPRSYQTKYKAFFKSIDVPYKNFHVLRHTFATECIRLGIDVKTVSEILGHSSVKITLDKYVHSSMDMKRKQLEKLYACV